MLNYSDITKFEMEMPVYEYRHHVTPTIIPTGGGGSFMYLNIGMGAWDTADLSDMVEMVNI